MKARKSVTTIVGACLAAVAGGSLVLFSIFAQDATRGASTDDSGVQVATPGGSAPVISLPGTSNAGGDGGAQGVAPDGSGEPLTEPLALLLEPLTPGDLVAQLGSPDGDPTGSTSTPPSAGPTAPGPDEDAVANVPERIERFGMTLDPDARDVRAGLRALRADDGGRPSSGDGGSEGPGKNNGRGKDKDKPDNRGHDNSGDKSNKGGKGHGGDKGRASKSPKGKKSKAPKAKSKARRPKHSNGRGHQKRSSKGSTRSKPQKSHAPRHSTGPPAQSKSKAPKPATSKTKSSPGRAAGGHPGKSKAKKRN